MEAIFLGWQALRMGYLLGSGFKTQSINIIISSTKTPPVDADEFGFEREYIYSYELARM